MCLVSRMVKMWFVTLVHVCRILVRCIITSHCLSYECTKYILCKNICLIWEIFILWLKAFVAIKYSKIIKSHCSFDYNDLISLYLLGLESEAERNVLMEEFYPQLYNCCKEKGCNSSGWTWGGGFQVVSEVITTMFYYIWRFWRSVKRWDIKHLL